MKVYDILGKESATLVNETKEAGSYEVTFDASQLASGVYIYRLIATDAVNNQYIFQKKTLLVR